MAARPTLLCLLLTTCIAVVASADVGGVRSAPPGVTPVPGIASPATFTLADAWNDSGTPDIRFYGANCFGFPYVPGHDYVLTRIEFFSGDDNFQGVVTMSVLTDNGSGLPTGPILGTVTYQEGPPRRWQGANLIPSVPLHGGTLYFIRYQPVFGALTSIATSGVLIPHTWSILDCANFFPVEPAFPWMARFYSEAVTPTQRRTWGRIKAIYR
jgi:hypothetical protein